MHCSNACQLRELIIKSTLKKIGLYSDDVLELVFATACAESLCGEYIAQVNGPALRIYQMEPVTAKDIYKNFLKYKPELKGLVDAIRCEAWSLEENLVGNLYFATAMCRVHYYRQSDPLPKTKEGMAKYWKKYYNTRLGKGTVEGFMEKWGRFE